MPTSPKARGFMVLRPSGQPYTNIYSLSAEALTAACSLNKRSWEAMKADGYAIATVLWDRPPAGATAASGRSAGPRAGG